MGNFEPFHKASRGGQPLPDGRVSLNKLNNLYFSAFSVHFPRAGHAEVLVAEDDRGNAVKLAVRPVPVQTDNSYSVQSAGMKGRTAITIAALVRQYKIPQAQYSADWNAEEEMLVVHITGVGK